MARPTGWDILGLDGDPTPGVVESVQALAKEFGDFAHDVESAYRSLNSFGSDASALQWIGQTADAFKGQFGPLPGRLQKLYTSYSEASDALSAYAPQLQAAQSKADAALRQAQDAHADLQRATTTANSAATDLKTAQQNQAANPNQQAVTDAQTAHDTAQTNLNNAKAKMADLAKQANDAYNDRINAAKTCASALHHAQSDGIHNKHWWEHVGEALSEWGGKIAEIANDLAPFLDVLALATSWIPGVDVITAGLAEADNLIALAGTGLEVAGDAMQGHWGDALMGAGMLGVTFLGGKTLEKFGGKFLGKEAHEAEGSESSFCKIDPIDVVSGQMLTDETDLSLPGVLPVILRRSYASAYETGRLFGPGWSSTLDQRVAVNAAGIHFAGDDSQILHYALPEGDSPVLPERGARWPLVWDRQTDEIRIADPWSGLTRHFAVVHHSEDVAQIRDLTAISDRNGNRTDFVRDERGTPVAVEHAGYRVAVEASDTDAGVRVTGLRLLDGSPDGVTVKRFQYDDRGRLVGVVDSSNLPYNYEYDDADRIVAWVDRVGYRYVYEYDEGSRVVHTRGDGGYLSGSFAYDDEHQTTVFTNSLGDSITYVYDELGHLISVTDPLGNQTRAEFDRYGRPLSRTDALGRRTVYELGEHGDVVRQIGPDGAVTELDYDEHHHIVAARTPDGALRQQRYDEHGNLVVAIDPLGVENRFAYGGDGALHELTDGLGTTTRVETDAAGLPVATIGPLGEVTRVVRDTFGRITTIVDPVGGRTEYGWTVEGRPAWYVAPDGGRWEWSYDAEGRQVGVLDPLGSQTVFELGPFGSMVARVDPTGERHEFELDTELRQTSVTNSAGATWRYVHDAAGQLVSETDFIGRTLAYEHDAAGQLTARIDGLGNRSEFLRDAAGRITVRRTSDGEFAYERDAMGRLTRTTGPCGADVVFVYDAAGRVVSETADDHKIVSEYDAAGRRIRRTSSSGAVSTWSFDAAGRPAALTAGAGKLDFQYDAASRLTGVVLGPQAWLEQGVDAAGRLVAQRLWNEERPVVGGQPALGRDIGYRPDGVPAVVTDSLRGVRRYDLDPAGRVTGVRAEAWSETYAYDAFGNVAQADLPTDSDMSGARTTDRTLIRQAGRTAYDYDAAGRLVRTIRRTLDGRRKEWTYSWNADDQLVQVGLPDGTAWHYRYDPLGRRTAKEHVAAGAILEAVRFVWDGGQLVEQHSSGGDGGREVLTWDYDPGTSRPAAQRRRHWVDDASQEAVDEVFHAIVTDQLGTPSELVDQNGRIVWHTTTSLWGTQTAVSADDGVDCPLRFPGQYYDAETGLHYNRFRYYDPETAAYLTPDPLGLAPAPNDRAYVPNPLVWADPYGLACTGTTEPGSTDLSQAVIQERLRLGKKGNNFAAARYIDDNGVEQIAVAASSKGQFMHAERKLLRQYGDKITEVYSEFEPCIGTNQCRKTLGDMGIKYTYSWAWTLSKDGVAANAARKAYVTQIFDDAEAGNWAAPWAD